MTDHPADRAETAAAADPEGGAAGPAESGAPAPAAAATGAGVAPAPVAAGVGRRGETLYFAMRSPILLTGLGVLLALLGLALIGPLFIDQPPNEYVGPPAQRPSGEYPFGTTGFGQDVYAQFVYGLRGTFHVGVLAASIAALVGMTVGFTAGYLGGIVDEILNMLTNVVLVLPVLVVLILISAYLPSFGVGTQAVIIGATTWPWVARAVRAQTFSLASRDFVDLARLSGVRMWKIIVRDIAPNMSSYLFMSFILLFAGAILAAAGLDFIGLGPARGVSLGLMMNHAVQWGALTLGMWWWFVPPGLGITALVGSLYLMNVGLDEVFNPKLREM